MRFSVHHRLIAPAIAMCGLVLAMPAQGQMGHGHMQQGGMQRHMATMHDMMQRMDTMMQRSQQMSHDMAEPMGQMPAGQMADQHRMTRQMSNHMGTMTEQMKGLVEQMQVMMKDEKMSGAMQGDAIVMEKHMGTMVGAMEKMWQSMERMQKRLAPPPKP